MNPTGEPGAYEDFQGKEWVASGGASAVAAPSGRVVWAAPSGRTSAEVVEVPLRAKRTVYGATGDAIVWVARVVVMLASLASGVYQKTEGCRGVGGP